MKKGFFIPFIFFVWLVAMPSPHAFAQTSEELKKEQKELEQEIGRIKSILDATSKNEKASLGALQLLQREVALRKKLLNSLNRQLKAIDNNLVNLAKNIKVAEQKIDTLKHKYAKNVAHQYVTRPTRSWWKYFLKNNTLNSSIKMFTYLNGYRKSILKQSEEIKQMKAQILLQMEEMDREKERKNQAAQKKTEEVGTLKTKEDEAKKVVRSLQNKKKQLQQSFKEKQKEQNKLKQQIAQAIRREIEEEKKRMVAEEKAKKESEKQKTSKSPSATTPKRTSTPVSYNPEFIAELNKNFLENKGKMPWPVNGIVVSSYGSDIFEGYAVSGKNIGTTFRSDVGSNVVSIADGIISSSLLFRGMYTIIIRHGNYFSGYSNLQSISVKKGETVKGNTVIGTVAKSDDGDFGELSLQIADLKGNVNPEHYLHK